MVCERCGGTLETYQLDGRDAFACRECGYVDVPVEHEPDSGRTESWWDAIDRFKRTRRAGSRADLSREGDSPLGDRSD